jgi:DNA-binding transcriptional regulator GbsR (MarR family)
VDDEAAVQEFIEQLGLIWDRFGANRTIGRMIGWLMICDPPEQTAADLAQALQISKASVSTATRALEAMGLVQRVARPGERRIRYRMPPGAWDATTQLRIRELEHIRGIARQGQRALAGRSPEQCERIDDFVFWSSWMIDRYNRLLQEWREERPWRPHSQQPQPRSQPPDS